MNSYSMAGAIALSLAVAACEDSRTTAPDGQNAGTAASSSRIFSATGDVTAVAGDRVTIAHGPVEGLDWPAMTMAFRASDPAALNGIGVGDRVAFQFRQAGDDYVVASIAKAQ